MDFHLQQLKRAYQATQSPEIGYHLISVLLRNGARLSDLRNEYPHSLVWDVWMGYTPGHNQHIDRKSVV